MDPRRPLANVLVATDFSAAGRWAVERAANLPLAPGSTLTVLHVLLPDTRPDERAGAERALDEAASSAAATAAGSQPAVHVARRILEGKPFVEIIREARRGRNELTVVGRHGERTLRDQLLGSTAERVIRKGGTAVLVVATPARSAYERPLVAVDLSDPARRALELAWRIVGPRVSTLEVVHAYDLIAPRAIRAAGFSADDALEYQLEAGRRARETVEAFLAGAEAAPVQILAREGDARTVIADLAARRDADLLALGTHGRSGLAHILIGSVAEAVIRTVRCDVLATRPLALELP
jgi:nucleotide-binding universal stress UspA family protein